MNQKKKVRLSDIAKKLNISTVTVSKALSNKDGVGDELRKQIKNLAEEMGYQVKKTSSQGASSDSDSTGNIGILIPSHFFSPNFSFYWFLFNHLSQQLMERNYYSIMELLSHQDEDDLNLPRMLQDKKVDGLIILGQVSPKYLDAVHSHYDNFVLLDFYTDRMHLDSVSNDDYYCSYMLTNYVISQGHRKLRFVGNFNATTSIQDRYMGFQKALLENNISTSIDQIINDRDTLGNDVKIQLPINDMPTAFICNCDETAALVIEELKKNGFKVPEDISVTGFDNFIAKNQNTIPLTTVYIKPEDTASITADLIIKKIKGESYIKGRHLVSGSLIIRDSVKKIDN